MTSISFLNFLLVMDSIVGIFNNKINLCWWGGVVGRLLSISVAVELMLRLARYLSVCVLLLLGEGAWPVWPGGRKTPRPELPS